MVVYTEPKTADFIPVIDLGPSFAAEGRMREKIAAEIGIAARGTGFFYVANHGVDPKLIETAFAQAERFFDQPLHDKIKMASTPQARFGYEASEQEKLDTDSPGDLKEMYSFLNLVSPQNNWPSNLPEFKEKLDAYVGAMMKLGRHISGLLAMSLKLPYSHFDSCLDGGHSVQRLIRYQPHPSGAKENQLGAGAHTDFGWITLLAQDNSGGLEVETASGDWVRATPIPGTFVINLGDLVPRWTNGLYHSNMHRVLNKSTGRNRHSMATFYSPKPETRVECLPTCLAPGETPKYPPCTFGEHLQQRVAASHY